MRFSRLTLRNWRNFNSVDVELQHRVFLVGPNASGKSNFLDVFRFLRDLASPDGGLQKAVRQRGGVSRIRSLAATRRSDVTIDTEVDLEDATWRYALEFNQDSKTRRPVVKREEVRRDGELILGRPDQADRDDPERLTQTHLEQVTTNRAFRCVAEFFASVRYYHIVPQLVRDPERSQDRHDDPYGSDFLERIARTSKKTRNARLRRIEQALKVAVPQLTELKLEKDEAGRPHLLGRYQHWRARGSWQSESDFSDGTLRLAGLLWSLLDKGGPLLLEEPELSLHPEIVRHIPAMMARVLQRKKKRQVLLSTHSSDLLADEGIAPDEVLLFIPGGRGTEVRSGVRDSEVSRLLESGLTVAEVVIPKTSPRQAGQLSLFEE
ncbi:MAG TPA: chromosome segregation protein SMC [Clostridiales bacterium]|nr:chromosome segregation protein SMC [Clostridiales bacterium]